MLFVKNDLIYGKKSSYRSDAGLYILSGRCGKVRGRSPVPIPNRPMDERSEEIGRLPQTGESDRYVPVQNGPPQYQDPIVKPASDMKEPKFWLDVFPVGVGFSPISRKRYRAATEM